jgi:formate-dependent nitrite reductase cytochrome c552 subunit
MPKSVRAFQNAIDAQVKTNAEAMAKMGKAIAKMGVDIGKIREDIGKIREDIRKLQLDIKSYVKEFYYG